MRLPKAPEAYSPTLEQQRNRRIERADAENVKRGDVFDVVLLRAPNGTVHQVQVDNAGVLSAVAV